MNVHLCKVAHIFARRYLYLRLSCVIQLISCIAASMRERPPSASCAAPMFRFPLQMAPLDMYTEQNTKCNLPAQIDISAVAGGTYELLFIAKGGGSANKTFLYQQTKVGVATAPNCKTIRYSSCSLFTSIFETLNLVAASRAGSSDLWCVYTLCASTTTYA